MKTEKNILLAFLLNLCFAIIELFGGVFTNSVSILSDAIHDFGDALSIGVSFVLEKISKKKPDNSYTYGYVRYSILGAFITTTVLTIGSVLVFVHGIERIFNPVPIHYDGMLILAILGVAINLLAAYFTKEGNSANQKAVNLHMLEDILGWVVVLVGSIVMKFTDFSIIDSLMSIGVAVFILVNALRNFKEILDLFLEKTPKGISLDELKNHLLEIDGVSGVHHIHVWSMDGNTHFATMHVVVTENEQSTKTKHLVREELAEHGISHATIEIETIDDTCDCKECNIKSEPVAHSHHHHHHH